MDPNDLIAAAKAIKTLESATIITKRQANKARKDLSAKLNDQIGYWNDKGQLDIADALNNAYRSIAA